MFQMYSDPTTATAAYSFTQTGKTTQIKPDAGTDESEIVVYFWDDPDRILLILRTDGVDATKKQLTAVEKWLKANYFSQALIKDKSWKSGSNGLASAETKDGSGLYIKMPKKSKVTQAKLDAGCAKVMSWLGAPDASKPANTGDSKPADTKSGNGTQPTNNGGGSKPADKSGTKPAPAPFKYDDAAGGAANLDAFLASLGWNTGDKK